MKLFLELLTKIREDKECIYLDRSFIPRPPEGLLLPEDIILFYTHCGGVELFPNKNYSMKIVAPQDFVRANPIIAGTDGEDDRSYNWFIIGESGSQYITIDLAQERLGRCYDSFWETHALKGNCPVIATSFTELLESLYQHKGEYWYWLRDDFHSLGDAYN
ncbi:SMI1/KNR4 family protein [Cytophagaceae bacterium DM2B3-1]|uniref:SMI1/KNR4 family protein n=1 Tax=Xanthocytophaga flava TaxID=3048013 RepID=A0ABT7CVT4_9BACT|nr:SMI1/KNR4 family protein [Xanthocytophaga flavus]MDJ1472405.1 SMI1/KNR4 family protein [Xanthocytophaga flavus]MDJ1497847.1 SMI1/KNR4 family protein [Xanthocytophaga flavus]